VLRSRVGICWLSDNLAGSLLGAQGCEPPVLLPFAFWPFSAGSLPEFRPVLSGIYHTYLEMPTLLARSESHPLTVVSVSCDAYGSFA
jgi:hypothetical protein